jgi:NYN domain
MTNAAESQSISTPVRAALYVDGFNLYHPIHEIGEPHLKWACLWRLGELICKRHSAKLVKVVFCTAVPDEPADKRERHNRFNAAQRANGVTVIKGHHVYEPDKQKMSEKQSDINVALSLILDGVDDVYDIAILLTADSDQAATARTFKERFPDKKLLAVAPPNKIVPNKVRPYAFAAFSLSKQNIDDCVMREIVVGKTGPITRPVEYAPPEWWMHPDDRPQGKPPKAKISWSKPTKMQC